MLELLNQYRLASKLDFKSFIEAKHQLHELIIIKNRVMAFGPTVWPLKIVDVFGLFILSKGDYVTNLTIVILMTPSKLITR